jgi:transposase-like protein
MLTPERAEAIVRSVAGGATKENAARAAGVHPATLFDWQARGNKALEEVDSAAMVGGSEAVYAEFAEALMRAEATIEDAVASAFAVAAMNGTDWRASEAWLKRRRPEEWAPPEKTQHDVSDKLGNLLATSITIDDDEG